MPPVPPIVNEYTEYLRSKRDDRYVRQVARILSRFMLHAKLKDPAECEASHIDSWLTYRQNSEGIGPKTYNNELSAISAFFVWLRRTRRVSTDPCRDIPSEPIVPLTEYDELSVDQVKRIVAVAEADEALPLDHEDRRHYHHRSTIYPVAYYTGLRRGGLKGLHVGDFADGPSPVLHLRALAAKNGKPLALPVGPQAAEILRRLTAGRRPQERLWAPFPHDRVFLGDFHAAGISGPGGLQRFRVTTATMLVESGADPQVAQAVLGHAHVSTTLKHYARAKRKKLAGQVSLLPDLQGVNEKKFAAPRSSGGQGTYELWGLDEGYQE